MSRFREFSKDEIKEIRDEINKIKRGGRFVTLNDEPNSVIDISTATLTDVGNTLVTLIKTLQTKGILEK